MAIPTLPATAGHEDIATALGDAGCVVVTGVFSEQARHAIQSELAPYMAKTPVADDEPEDFYPGKTRRVSALVATSESAHDLILDRTSLAMCDHFLLPNSEYGYQVHVTAALEVGPGARKQILHREHDSFTFFEHPRPNIIVASMWAISDFTAENGATLIVPGSHKWTADRKPNDDEVLSAEMPAGSVLFWLGGTLHGAGANITENEWRYGVIITYSLGWVRQEENQYLHVPAEKAAQLPEELRNLIGYKMYDALGFAVNTAAGESPV